MEHPGSPVYSGPGAFRDVVDPLLVQPRLNGAMTILYYGLEQVGRGKRDCLRREWRERVSQAFRKKWRID